MTYASPTTINATQGFMSIIYYVNNVTDQWIANITILGLWFIILAGYYKASDDFAGALGVSGFIMFILGLLAWLSGFISPIVFGIITGLSIISVIILFADRGNS